MQNAFDIFGDIHGCLNELRDLLQLLGYEFTAPDNARHPEKRRIILLGDLVNRGPDTPGVLRLVMNMVDSGSALSVLGNHDAKLLSFLKDKSDLTPELKESVSQLNEEPQEFRQRVIQFLDDAPTQLSLDNGKLVVAHAGLKESLQGVDSPEAREFAVNGPLTGEVDEYGKPVRYNWAADYHGKAFVVYGHTPFLEPTWLNRTINIDTGCVYGGKLTALRYPQMELVSVPAAKVYHPRKKPIT